MCEDVAKRESLTRELDLREDTARFPVADPGIEPHIPRLTDIDEKAADRATRQVATMFGLVPLLAIGFVVIYFAVPRTTAINLGFFHANAQHVGLGLTLGFAILLIGMGAVQWARQIMADHEVSDERHEATSSPEDRVAIMNDVDAGIEESQINRRKVLGYSLIGALGALVLPVIAVFADLGPWPTKKVRAATIEHTIWSEGVRLVTDITYEPIKAADIEIGQLVNAQPANLEDLEGVEFLQEKAKAAIIIVRMNPNTIKIPESRKDWAVGGILCYSKICTHVGCPISLWEQQTHHLLCPCHQSTFDLGDSGVVVFGPAARALPQLPITTDAEGYLVARSGFTVPVGPSYFERDSRKDYKQGDN
ncbi:MAG: Rieske 2Fe-2S domain-containing protein [Propionibacteriaceae bacterium]|nr:Rieske 2Fe-2S domain-containing protein [Propionibacteriaceae bacterium]